MVGLAAGAGCRHEGPRIEPLRFVFGFQDEQGGVLTDYPFIEWVTGAGEGPDQSERVIDGVGTVLATHQPLFTDRDAHRKTTLLYAGAARQQVPGLYIVAPQRPPPLDGGRVEVLENRTFDGTPYLTVHTTFAVCRNACLLDRRCRGFSFGEIGSPSRRARCGLFEGAGRVVPRDGTDSYAVLERPARMP